MFSVLDSLICEYTDAMDIVCQAADENAGLVAEIVGSFGRLNGQWARWFDT